MKKEELKKVVKKALICAASDASETYDGRPSRKWGILYSPEARSFEICSEQWNEFKAWDNPYQIFTAFYTRKIDILSIWDFFSKEDIFFAASTDEKKSLERLNWRSDDVSVMDCFDECGHMTRSELVDQYALYDADGIEDIVLELIDLAEEELLNEEIEE